MHFVEFLNLLLGKYVHRTSFIVMGWLLGKENSFMVMGWLLGKENSSAYCNMSGKNGLVGQDYFLTQMHNFGCHYASQVYIWYI